MSYYQKNKFIITDHALIRVKQRIENFKHKSDFEIVQLLNDYLNNTNVEFSDNNYDYYHYDCKIKYLYIVVKRCNSLIISVTPISHAKKINLLT